MWTYNTDYLAHHGIKGQKWGVRRYQNPDGSLTPAGQKRYNKTSSPSNTIKKIKKIYDKSIDAYDKIREENYDYIERESMKRTNKSYDDLYDEAAKQNPDLDSGKLKYKDSLWKQINDIEDEAQEIYQKKHDKIYEKTQKEMVKIGEKFIDSQFEQKGIDKMTSSEVYEMLGDENWGYVNAMIDAIISGNKYNFDYEDYSIRKK